MIKSGYGSIVAERTIRFDKDTWAWAKEQDNLSERIRELIYSKLSGVKRGRPSKATRYRIELATNDNVYTRGDKND